MFYICFTSIPATLEVIWQFAPPFTIEKMLQCKQEMIPDDNSW